MTSTALSEDGTGPLRKYGWGWSLVAILGGVIATLTLVTHLTARTEPVDGAPARPAAQPLVFQAMPGLTPIASSKRSKPAAVSRGADVVDRRAAVWRKPSNPLEVVIGPSAISGQFKLLKADRATATPTSDKLTLRVRVVSRAMADLVTPFQSEMLEVRSEGLEPIGPDRAFSYPVAAGDTREEDVVFTVPSGLKVDGAVLRIHYYNEVNEIPLGVVRGESGR